MHSLPTALASAVSQQPAPFSQQASAPPQFGTEPVKEEPKSASGTPAPSLLAQPGNGAAAEPLQQGNAALAHAMPIKGVHAKASCHTEPVMP